MAVPQINVPYPHSSTFHLPDQLMFNVMFNMVDDLLV
uniref:Uncharacterized protein n=1 Tax=Anguilla anguilla TaxID=7936 RepID=A0A0E9QXE7_ANGAN